MRAAASRTILSGFCPWITAAHPLFVPASYGKTSADRPPGCNAADTAHTEGSRALRFPGTGCPNPNTTRRGAPASSTPAASG